MSNQDFNEALKKLFEADVEEAKKEYIEAKNDKKLQIRAEIIAALLNDSEIERKSFTGEWVPFSITDDIELRIKPKEPEWWENIPEHGILVKNNTTPGVIIVMTDQYADASIHWTPLTNEEIERFKR